jgi:tetratricopeptide (TPR) repeat protein
MTFSNLLKAVALMIGAALLFTAAPAKAEWLKAETEHFVIVGDTSNRAISEYARKVERFHAMLFRFLPPDNDDVIAPKLWIYLADGRDDMQEIWPGIGRGVGGFYSRSDERIYAVVDVTNEDSDHTLFHEYAHHYMFQYHNTVYPGWFVEGFAEYFAPSDMRMGRIRYGLYREGRIYSLNQTNSWVPMDDVLRSRLTGNSAQRGAAYYAQAWLLTHYLLGAPERHAQLQGYLIAIARGDDPIEALEVNIGRTPDELGAEMRSYMRRGITTFTLQEALPNATPAVTSLPRSTGDAIWLDLRSARPLGDDGPALVAQARAVVDRYPNDRLPLVTLAKLQRKTDDLAGARATLEHAMTLTPDDAEVRWLMGAVLTRQSEDIEEDETRRQLRRQALAHLNAAYEADPLDYRIYLAMLENRREAANYPSDNDVVIAESAFRLAPQLGTTAVEAARLLMAKDRYLDAAYVLGPLANNPHGGDSLASVRSLLAEAREKAGLSAVSTEAPPEAPNAGEDEEGDAVPPSGD